MEAQKLSLLLGLCKYIKNRSVLEYNENIYEVKNRTSKILLRLKIVLKKIQTYL